MVDTALSGLGHHAGEQAVKARRRDIVNRWLLSAPALIIIAFAAIGPLFIMAVYSFLAKGPYGGVIWQFSTEGWYRLLFEKDIFDDTVSFADAHLTIFWRSAKLSLATTLLALLFGFPTAYFIATRPERYRELWLFLITIPFWTNLLIRTFAIMEVIRNEGLLNSLLLKLGLIEPLAAPVYRLRHHAGHGLCLPAPDGFAALRQYGETGFPPHRGGL